MNMRTRILFQIVVSAIKKLRYNNGKEHVWGGNDADTLVSHQKLLKKRRHWI